MHLFVQFLEGNFNVIGMIGAVVVLLAYFLLQINQLSQDSIFYSFANLIGSIFILLSLYFAWNLASGIIEIVWLIISAIGLIKSIVKKTKRASS